MKRAVLFVLLALAIAAWFALDLGDYLTLDMLKAQRVAIGDFYQANPLLVLALLRIPLAAWAAPRSRM